MPFSQATFDFLFENRMRDSREWFHKNKEQYNDVVLQPLRELVVALTPALLEIDDQLITEPKVSRTISRIYRDTRFSRDKSLYRDVMWLTFCRVRQLRGHMLPAFYFEISPSGYAYGCGYYETSREMMTLMREKIVARDKGFLAAHRAYKASTLFEIEGERYKRPHFPDEPEEYRDWLERKSICFTHNGKDAKLLFSDRLADHIAEGFRALKDVYRFLLDCELELIATGKVKDI